MRTILLLILWRFGCRGRQCRCSFYEASHYDNSLEFDINDYPCRNFGSKTHDHK